MSNPGAAIRVAALTSSRDDPSSRFRMRQFLKPLQAHGIHAVEYCPWIGKYAPAALQLTGIPLLSTLRAVVAARHYDVAWLNRELITGRATLERFAGRRVIFDVDDAIWLTGGSHFAQRIAALSCGVIAGNEWIGEYFTPHARKVWVVPTSVDVQVWRPARRSPEESFTVGWSGTWWNLKYLYAIERQLAAFVNGHPGSRLLVVCDRRPKFERLRSEQWTFLKWSPDVEVSALQQMDVGIMPLEENEWTRGKCALKMLCCMSVGLPVVATAVGVARELLERGNPEIGLAARTGDDFYEHLRYLRNDRPLGAAMGAAGREIVMQDYSLDSAVRKLAAIFAETAQC